ncbi:hypothetical protein ACVOZ6_004700 [Escherichia coli]
MAKSKRIPRREVFLVYREFSDGTINVVSGLQKAMMYHADGAAQYRWREGTVEHVPFRENNHDATLYHLPGISHGEYHATYSEYGAYPELPEDGYEFEYVLFIAAYSNDRSRTLALLNMAADQAYDIINGKRNMTPGTVNLPFVFAEN